MHLQGNPHRVPYWMGPDPSAHTRWRIVALCGLGTLRVSAVKGSVIICLLTPRTLTPWTHMAPVSGGRFAGLEETGKPLAPFPLASGFSPRDLSLCPPLPCPFLVKSRATSVSRQVAADVTVRLLDSLGRTAPSCQYEACITLVIKDTHSPT